MVTMDISAAEKLMKLAKRNSPMTRRKSRENEARVSMGAGFKLEGWNVESAREADTRYEARRRAGKINTVVGNKIRRVPCISNVESGAKVLGYRR